jgi:hypothetical protein
MLPVVSSKIVHRISKISANGIMRESTDRSPSFSPWPFSAILKSHPIDKVCIAMDTFERLDLSQSLARNMDIAARVEKLEEGSRSGAPGDWRGDQSAAKTLKGAHTHSPSAWAASTSGNSTVIKIVFVVFNVIKLPAALVSGLVPLLLLLSVISARLQAQTATLEKYCSGCHDEKLKTGGFVLDPSGLDHPERQAESWEKVVRKLRGRSMPPAGLPRPDDQTYQTLLASIDGGLDRASLAHRGQSSHPVRGRLE